MQRDSINIDADREGGTKIFGRKQCNSGFRNQDYDSEMIKQENSTKFEVTIERP